MRIAHIIMAHKDPDQLFRLINRLQHPDADFFIHVDLKSDIQDFKKVLNLNQTSFIKNRRNCNWGGSSFLMAIISTMTELLSLNKDYSFFNLLSAQDYPLKPVKEIHQYFKKNQDYNFIFYEPLDSVWWESAQLRYKRYHLTDFNFKGRYFVEKVMNTLLPVRQFPMDVTLYGGCKSAWWTLTQECASYVCNQVNDNKQLTNFLKYCWGTDEFIIPTLIMNSHHETKTKSDNLRYIDWSEGNAHPKLLNSDDFKAIKNSGMLFARKFKMDDAILDKIDQELLTLE